jgi:hypothetical protein
VDELALGRVRFPVFQFCPVGIITSMVFICMLLLPDGQTGEAWESPNKAVLFRISGSNVYRGSDKSLARPGRKQATAIKL